MVENKQRELIDLIRKPIITDKTTKLIENNQYCFFVKKTANKTEIKNAIEYIFRVTVKQINTLNSPIKIKTVGKYIGKKSQYKKAIITLIENDKINLFPDN